MHVLAHIAEYLLFGLAMGLVIRKAGGPPKWEEWKDSDGDSYKGWCVNAGLDTVRVTILFWTTLFLWPFWFIGYILFLIVGVFAAVNHFISPAPPTREVK